ncbi:hypothetical protein CHCC20441_2842 [Bacillus licheniformis]|nr:hypothetical protein CHCC5025_2538 [Bacillus licheniformis]TWJ38428.1 hypothetical protein CHCC5026_1629 [Bacillus licheniformis]TWJ69224.1 hypothetical protein CHCC5020_0044 [Bacillus licheniformis]TWJ84831.1 hypothetical protein CHCC20496_4254 [Bacillus licheniformis]TWJ94387.1 hypothetical protein CHCC20493_0547 [Bacillus licheniformis]
MLPHLPVFFSLCIHIKRLFCFIHLEYIMISFIYQYERIYMYKHVPVKFYMRRQDQQS